jgi:hypothetical protein
MLLFLRPSRTFRMGMLSWHRGFILDKAGMQKIRGLCRIRIRARGETKLGGDRYVAEDGVEENLGHSLNDITRCIGIRYVM